MTALIFNANQQIATSSGAITHYANGLPMDSSGNLVVSNGTSAPSAFSGGWPFDASGGVAIDSSGVINTYQNGLPFTVAGRIVASNNGTVISFTNGLPLNSSGVVISGAELISVDWRAPMTMATSAGLSGSLAALTAAQATSASKSRPSFTITGVATEYVEATAIIAGTYLVSWLGELSTSTTTITKNAVSVPYAQQFPSGTSLASVTGTGGRRQVVSVVCVPGDVIRFTSAGTVTRTIYLLIHKKPTSGSMDSYGIIGASRETDGVGCKLLEDAIIADDATRDPLVFNWAASGASFTTVASLVPAFTSTYDGVISYAYLGNLMGGYITPNHPYSSAQDTAINTEWTNVVNGINNKFTMIVSNHSFRNYGIDGTNLPATPPTSQTGGSKGYNDAHVNPRVLSLSPNFYNSTTGTSYHDIYSDKIRYRFTLIDGIHGSYASDRTEMVRGPFKFTKTGSWASFVTIPESMVTTAETNATNKALSYNTFIEAQYVVDGMATSADKTSKLARLAAIKASAYFYDAVRQIDLFVASQYQPDKDAAQAQLTLASSYGWVGTSPNTIADQQARINAVSVITMAQICHLALGTSSAITGFNVSTSITNGVVFANLTNTASAASGISFTWTDAPNIASSASQAIPSAFSYIPNTALLFTDTDTNDTIVGTFGVNPLKTYQVFALPSRGAEVAYNCEYLINGVLQPGVFNAANNGNTMMLATGITGVSTIALTCRRYTGGSNVYMGVIGIRELP